MFLGATSDRVQTRKNTIVWVSEDQLVYAGLSDIYINRNVDSALIPEAVLPVLSKSTFRSVRKMESNDETQKSDGFQLIATSLDGHIRIISFTKNTTTCQWRYSILYDLDVLISPDELVDSFGFRAGDQLSVVFATLHSVRYWRICGDDTVKQTMAALPESPMINCFHVYSNPSSSAFLILFALTNKKIGSRMLKNVQEDSEFRPALFDTRDIVNDMDLRLG